MRCRHCGEIRSSVLDTRDNGDAVTRRRACFNGHVFVTTETYKAVVKMTRKLEAVATTTDRRATRWKRDQRIVHLVRQGRLKSDVAAEFGIAATTVSHVLGKYAPELKRRMPRGR